MSTRTVDVGDGHIVTHLDEPAPRHPERAACTRTSTSATSTKPRMAAKSVSASDTNATSPSGASATATPPRR